MFVVACWEIYLLKEVVGLGSLSQISDKMVKVLMVFGWHLGYIAVLHLNLAEFVHILAVHQSSTRYDYY